MDSNPKSASMPLLRSLFFKTYPPKAEFWAEWKSLGSWTENLCPIYAWEGSLFVGCTSLETTAPSLESSTKIILVLCEEQVLKEYFDLISSMQVSSLATPSEAIGPAVTALPSTSTPSEDPFAGMTASLSGEAEDSVLKEEGEDAEGEKSHDSSESESSDKIEDQIAGLAMDLSAQTVTLIPLSSSPLTPSAPNPESPVAAPPETPAEPATPAAAAVEKMASSTTAIAKPPSTGDMSEYIFKEMHGQFIKSMLFRKEGNALIPWKWDPLFQPTPQTQENPISLGQPSPFRIVAKTLKPYHGFISPCDIAEKFFEDWNSSQIPDHLTVVPIIIEEEMVGALLGIAEKSVNQKASLHLSERLASEMEMSMRSDIKEVAS